MIKATHMYMVYGIGPWIFISGQGILKLTDTYVYLGDVFTAEHLAFSSWGLCKMLKPVLWWLWGLEQKQHLKKDA